MKRLQSDDLAPVRLADVSQVIERLVEAARQAGRDQSIRQGSGSEIPVNAARKRLLDLLDRLGIDGGGWHSEREILTDERDRALAKVDELEEKIFDLHHRLQQTTQERDNALADHTIYVYGVGDTA